VVLEAEGERELPPEIQIALYRIAQEALNNVVKHAEATEATVRLFSRESGVELRVSDNGKGLDLQQSMSSNHLGLRIMQERAEANAIDLHFVTRPAGGTEVVAEWPAPVEESEAS
jgi:signal transduction histidine kinase